MKGKNIVDPGYDYEDEELKLSDLDEEGSRHDFNIYTLADIHDPKFHVGHVFHPLEMLRKPIRIRQQTYD